MDGPGGGGRDRCRVCSVGGSLRGWPLHAARIVNSDEWQAMVANKSDDMTVLPVRQYRVFLSLLLFVYFRNFLAFWRRCIFAFSHFRILAIRAVATH